MKKNKKRENMSKTLLLGAIASIIAINSVVANTIVTSQTYVDNADARKVDIAQGTGTNNANVGKTLIVNSSGNLELGTVSASNFVEDSITDGVTDKAPSENAVNDALAEKQDIIPAGSDGANGSVVTYGATAGDVDERFILDSDQYATTIQIAFANSSASLDSIARILRKTGEELNNSVVPAKYIMYGLNAKQYAITPGTTGSVAIFDGADQRGGSKFTERAIYDGSTTYDSTTDADKLITAGAVESKQAQKVCVRWLANADETDENCLLWNLP